MPKKEVTIEDLAVMVKKGFDNTATKSDIKDMATKSDIKDMATKPDIKALERKMDQRFSHVNARLDTIERDIRGFVTMEDFEDLMARVGYLEGRLGVVSGK